MRNVPIIYLAHEFGGNMDNLRKAGEWCGFLSLRVEAYFVAPWIELCRNWPDSGDTRVRGTEMGLHFVTHCDGLVAIQASAKNYLSPGQQGEWDAARWGHRFLISEIVMQYPDGDYTASELNRLTHFVDSLARLTP